MSCSHAWPKNWPTLTNPCRIMDRLQINSPMQLISTAIKMPTKAHTSSFELWSASSFIYSKNFSRVLPGAPDTVLRFSSLSVSRLDYSTDLQEISVNSSCFNSTWPNKCVAIIPGLWANYASTLGSLEHCGGFELV